MTEVNRTWRQWAAELADQVGDAAGDAVEVAMEATGTDVAIDYWSSKSPKQVTQNFRNATDEWVTDRFGGAAGDAARLATVPFGAAARFSVTGVQAFGHAAKQAMNIAKGRAPMPTAGELVPRVAVGTLALVDEGVDVAIHAVRKGARAVANGDYEGIAAAAEDGLTATLDVGSVVAGAQGVASGVKSITGAGVSAARFAALGASPLAVRLIRLGVIAAGVGEVSYSLFALGALSQAPRESRDGGRRSSEKANEARPSRSREEPAEWPKKKDVGRERTGSVEEGGQRPR
ncbi:MAG: hypothetical protein AAFQ65_03225 [Myxococcota bacterium]